MGATYAAIHVKGVSADRVVEIFERWLGARGFTREPEDGSDHDSDRRALVFADAGWAVLIDEDLTWSDELVTELGRHASGALATDAIAIAVAHSDLATIRRFRNGDAAGCLQIPEDANRDDATGNAVVRAPFLASLATSADAARKLAEGVQVNDVFVGVAVTRLVSLVGIPYAAAGMSWWPAPPAGTVRLKFAPPRVYGPIQHQPFGMTWTDLAVAISGGPHGSLYVGMPLDDLAFSIDANEGPPIEGVIVELSGSALELLDIVGAAAHSDEVHTLEPSSRGRYARFPHATIAPGWRPMIAPTTAATSRVCHAGVDPTVFRFQLCGTARTIGRGELVIIAFDLAGRSLDADPLRIEIDVALAPRVPVLPTPLPPIFEQPQQRAGLMRRLEYYGGTSWISGWFGFDAQFEDTGRFALDAASELGSWFARWAGPLEIVVVSAGTMPEIVERFRPGDALAGFGLAMRYLADEAEVRLQPPYGSGGPTGDIIVAHQPRGSTILDPVSRAEIERNDGNLIVPLEVRFALPRPDDAGARAELGGLLDDLAARAAAIARCVGGFVAPTGYRAVSASTMYEELAWLWGANDRLSEARRRPRAPGWRVIVPHAVVAAIDPQPGVRVTEVAAGLLLATAAPDPFAMTDDEREAIERTVLPAMTRRRRDDAQ